MKQKIGASSSLSTHSFVREGKKSATFFYADTGICYGFYCLYLIFNTLLEDVSENVDAMNESNLPLYILFFVIAMHSISITLIYRVLRPAE